MSGFVKLPSTSGSAGVSSLDGMTGALTLVAGSGITITDGSGTITIAATGGGGGSGTVTTVSVVSANGFAGTVTNPTTTPALTLTTTVTGVLKGDGTAISAATVGTDYSVGTSALTTGILKSTTTTGALSIAVAGTDYQAPGNYITALTGDATASGPGSAALTLTTVNSNVGSFGSASSVMTQTVNAKGLTTAAASVSIQIAESQVTNLVTDLAAKQSTTLTSAHILVGNVSNVATDVAMSGDISIANTGATSVAKIAGTTVSGTTGSTNVVFSNSPALVTPSLDTPSAITLTNATGLPLTTGVTGQLPIANGGTAASTAASARVNLNVDKRASFSDAPYTVLTTDRYVAQIGTLTASRVVTLPAANAVNAGQFFYIADESGTATTTNTITVTAAGSDTIDGVTTKSIRSAYGYVEIYSNGSNMWLSGVTRIGAGGTGLSVGPTNGQLLIGRSSTSDYNLTTLTAGTGVSVTNGSGTITIANTGVTSVDMTVPAALLSVSGNPVTTSGTLAIALATQSANTVFSGPSSGSAATPTFRSLVVADVPATSLQFFGNGVDGNVTISSGSTTLTRDMYYTNLTMSGTGLLKPAGFRVFVSGTLDITAAAANAIQFASSDGSAGNAGGTGGSPGGALTGGTLAGRIVGVIGGAGSTTNGVNAGNGVANTVGNGGATGTSGNGGTGSGGTAGAGGNGGVVGSTPIMRPAIDLLRGVSLIAGGTGAPGGGGGGGDTSVSGAGGGGGASGGGVLGIWANTINRGGSTPASTILAGGGIGGNGGSPASGNTGGGGGGSGGGGGWIYLVYNTLTGSTATNALDASGGAGGNGGTHQGTGTDGGGGKSGGQGRITVVNIGANTITDNVGATGTFNNATGATGGTANTYRVSL